MGAPGEVCQVGGASSGPRGGEEGLGSHVREAGLSPEGLRSPKAVWRFSNFPASSEGRAKESVTNNKLLELAKYSFWGAR